MLCYKGRRWSKLYILSSIKPFGLSACVFNFIALLLLQPPKPGARRHLGCLFSPSAAIVHRILLPLAVYPFSSFPLLPGPGYHTGPGPHAVWPGILTSFTCQPLVFMCTAHTAILSFLNELSVRFLPIMFQLLQWFSTGFRMTFKSLNLLSRFSPSKFCSIWPRTTSLASRQAIVCLSSPVGPSPLTGLCRLLTLH